MELHRLKPMDEDYNPTLFYELYEKTSKLRSKLVSQIDSRRYGVTPDIIKSWFDDKFIYTFNRYSKTKPDQLLGYIIKSLEFFKYRVLRKAYQENIYSNTIDLDSVYNIVTNLPEDLSSNYDSLLEPALKFMERELSEPALYIFKIELNPPPYILHKLSNPNNRISNGLIVEYLGLKVTPQNIAMVSNLRKEIEKAKEKAKEYFSKHPLALN